MRDKFVFDRFLFYKTLKKDFIFLLKAKDTPLPPSPLFVFFQPRDTKS